MRLTSFSTAVASFLTGPRWRSLPPQADVAGWPGFGRAVLLVMAALALAVAHTGVPKKVLTGVDVLSEGGMLLLQALWLVQLRTARPAGRVTTVLALGLGALLLGQWMDLLDEFWQLPKAVLWDNALESGFNLGGVVALTWGLHLWRQEQLAFTRAQAGRERLFREHRHLDALTALGDADYMAAQVDAEARRGRLGAMVMLGWQDFGGLVLQEGPAVGERLQQAAAQWLLLSLRPGDLLCHYAGDRFVVLLPDTPPAQAEVTAHGLREALAAYRCALPDGRRLQPLVEMAWRPLQPTQSAGAQMLALLDELHGG